MINESQRLQHALNTAIPDIKNGCVIQTAHGDVIFTRHDAERLGQFVRDLYQQKLKTALQIEGCAHCED